MTYLSLYYDVTFSVRYYAERVCPKHAVCICLSSTLLVIGPENSRHSLNQSNLRVKPIALESPAFSRAWRQLHVLALNLSFAQVGRCDYFSFGFMTLKGGASIVALETRLTYISIFQGSASDGKSNCWMVFIIQLTIGSTSACVHRDIKHAGSLESTKDA